MGLKKTNYKCKKSGCWSTRSYEIQLFKILILYVFGTPRYYVTNYWKQCQMKSGFHLIFLLSPIWMKMFKGSTLKLPFSLLSIRLSLNHSHALINCPRNNPPSSWSITKSRKWAIHFFFFLVIENGPFTIAIHEVNLNYKCHARVLAISQQYSSWCISKLFPNSNK